MRKGSAVYICGGEEFWSADKVPLDRGGLDCPNAINHAPMPASYGGYFGVGELRTKARQRQKKCPGCGLYRIVVGGRDVPGWPRTSEGLL